MSSFGRTHNVTKTWRMIGRLYSIEIGLETVRNWTNGKRNPSRKFHGRLISSPSSDLAYVIMAAKGDGCSGKRTNGRKGFLYNIEFRVKDSDFANRFAKSASLALNRARPYRIRKDSRGFSYVLIHSKALYEILRSIPFSPTHCFRYLESTHAITQEAIRGFFDAEGGPTAAINSRDEFLAEVVAANSELSMVELVKSLLNREGIPSRIEVNRAPPHVGTIGGRVVLFAKPTHYIRISRISAVLKFIDLIGSSIRRKALKLRDIKECLKLRARDRAKAWRARYYKNGKGEYKRKAPGVVSRHEPYRFG